MRRCPKCTTDLKPRLSDVLCPPTFRGRPFIRCSKCNAKITTQVIPHLALWIIGTIGFIPVLLLAGRYDGFGISLVAIIIYGLLFLLTFMQFVPLRVVDEDGAIFVPERIPDHESGVRRMVADSRGEPYHALRTFEEAKACPDGVVIFEGDYGGQIYVVVPVSLIKCTEQELKQLLSDLDALEWKDESGARVYYERRPIGSGVPGGMGGAVVTQDIWIHQNFVKLQLDSAIREVLGGKRKTLKE